MSASLENLPLPDTNIDRLNGQDQDPFSANPKAQQPHPHRFSAFDTQLFALNHPSSSPSQAKRALEAHLAETERRLQEASRLGTALVQQKNRLLERLIDVEAQQTDGEVSPELRQKLVNVEKEFNEVGRASARVFLGPKTDGAVPRESVHSPFALDGKRASSPSKFSSEASDSPSKLNVPRKLRNQPSNQVGNIEFAVEINTSLIAQVRQLQAVVIERDEALKAANLDRSRLEAEAEGFAQRLKSMDESEQRYKDENWNLETQTHEMIAAAKEATSREQKLQQLLATTTAEKSAADRELDELKQTHGRLIEDITVVRKNHEVELTTLRKNVNQGETEKASLKRKVEELTTQNQELAKAMTARFRDAEAEAGKDADPEPEDLSRDISDPEHSPPPSPTKALPRHTMLESETLKSSLHHAHRMIQNLKSSIHREKTEKAELKRVLQETRDELEVRKKDPTGINSENRKSRFKPQQDLNRKIRPNMLGAGREGKIHIMVDDAEWEEYDGERSPYRDEVSIAQRPNNGTALGQITDMSDAYQTANETEDSFETANEQESATENESYQPGVRRSPVESNDELTETEAGPARGRVTRGERPSLLIAGKAGDRLSYQSTASTSGDDDEQSSRTPIAQPQKYRLKIHRGPRRSRIGSETVESSTPPSAKNSPASFVSGGGGQEGQSLFAELGDLNGGDSGEDVDGTPTKRRTPLHGSMSSMNRNFGREKSTSSFTSSDKSTPGITISPENFENRQSPKIQLVDSATMTDPWEPVQGYMGQPNSVQTRANTLATDDPFVSQSVSADPILPSLQDSGPAESATSTSAWPRILDQPLGTLSNMIFNFGNTSESTPITSREGPPQVARTPELSDEVAYQNQTSPNLSENKQDLESFHGTHPRSVMNSSTLPLILPYTLSISPVQSLEIAPSLPADVNHDLRTWTPSPLLPHTASDAEPNLPTKPDVERITNTIFGSETETIPAVPYHADTETDREVPKIPQRDGRRRGSESFSIEQPKEGLIEAIQRPIPADVVDQSSQTLLSSDQIDRILLLNDKALNANSHKAAEPPTMKPLADIGAPLPPVSIQHPLDSKDMAKGKQAEALNRDPVPLMKIPRRPLSSASMRSRNGQYPPLPPDHQQAIAAAAQKGQSLEPPTGSMGPPLAPASAYRTSVVRPQTPSRSRATSQQPLPSPASKNGTTPRVRHSTSKSQMSRRSSVSSFASELDERFNIRVDNLPGPYGVQSGTDPRMIQAITQTMIGEYLWKYTRKAGRGDMSSNRHRRFFWVHPYTRTLYWSGKDPAIAGRAELKAKSVGIEAVQVVVDDNPMPPGLHRKSLVIFTPGRCIKLTATTGQRHETWFNALSYLLLRTNPEDSPSGADGTNITAEDIEDFNPSLSRDTSRATNSRISLSSFRYASSQRSMSRRTQAHLAGRRPPTASQMAHSSVASRHSQQAAPYYGSSSSRWSQYLRHGTSVRGSMSSRASQAVVPNEPGSSQYANMAHDSAEDLRQVIEQQEREADQLENVRACCDGRHDVGSLSKNSRHLSQSSRASEF